jgi:protein KTI12
MPLIILTGTPASGKSTRASQLKKYFEEEKQKTVHIISEVECLQNAGYTKNSYFEDSQKEKMIKADVKSQALRKLNKNDLVIIDAGNYIKGYRYEIYCTTKSSRNCQCTIFCAVDKERSWGFNETRDDQETKYSREIFDALWMRYEEPNSSNRWDSPLFSVTPDDELDLEGIYSVLYEKKPAPANQSTQNPPLCSTNFLFELDRITNEIVQEINSARKIGVLGPVKVNGVQEKVAISADINPSQLNRFRRQYINYSKMHLNSNTLENVPTLFVQYLNSVCNE